MSSVKRQRIVAGKLAVILAVIPILLFAYSSGPDPRNTGAVGDKTCNQVGCHVGSNMNDGQGSVTIKFPGDLTYTPGVKQRLTVTIAGAGQRLFGFQATARRETNLSRDQAGTFGNVDSSTQVLCDDGSIRPNAGCRANFPVEFIEHSRAVASGVYTIDWTPPATDVGNVRIYVAGNAANGNGTETGDRIYTASYVLTPAGVTPPPPPRPAISSNGVTDAFNGSTGVAPATWVSIAGTDLAASAKTWDGLVKDNTLPTAIDGVSVTVGNKPATVASVSATRLNVLTASDIGTGDMSVVVTNANGASTPMAVTSAPVKPALYAPNSGDGGKLYVTAMALDGTLVGNPGAAREAKPGEVIVVFGTGMGATKPEAPTTQVVTGAPAVTTPVRIRFNDTVANFAGTGNLVYAGVYQFNVTVPSTLADGEYALIVEQGGVASSDKVFITVKAQ